MTPHHARNKNNAAKKSFRLAYYQHRGYCIEIDAPASIESIIFSMSVKADNEMEAFNIFINEGLRRGHLNTANAARYKSNIRKNVASIRIN